MILKTIILINVMLLLPITSIAQEFKAEVDVKKIESMSIKSLIEKAKIASSDDLIKIENLIKKKIAQAHRESFVKG